ncbi:cupin domain-containing protein [Segetibacter aerophilus]|uniref:Cupin n=1 Tax=Segetibacter aerophilus TaxID=670293 RepID=A0A512BCJ1_9BACT|nr:cupin domain-containing protein [Segetibacter aerophilus]GEO09689.1 cupin [Segetibacter aerophilus]
MLKNIQTNPPPAVVSTSNATKYVWGKNCEAWNLLNNDSLSIKHEKMPHGAEEILHYHKQSQQFFYILKGRAVFEVDEVIVIVHEGEGLHLEAGRRHRIMNKDEGALEFLVISQPSTSSDRHNLV